MTSNLHFEFKAIKQVEFCKFRKYNLDYSVFIYLYMNKLTITLLILSLSMCGIISTTKAQQKQNDNWWESTSIYQIYPRSFMDSNADGIGDIKGIISKLDYIKQLGFETIWVSPFFKGPQRDFGYDISEYLAIDSIYGNMDDAMQLIDKTHELGMHIVFDLVLNHSSNENRWFLESIESKNNKTDWYIWKDGRGKRPPNNWKSLTGPNGWQFNKKRGQWYWASFLPFQPDLNWRNPDVKKAMFDIVNFWLKKGVDGFRLDIFNVIYEDSTFRKNPMKFNPIPTNKNPSVGFQKLKYSMNHPDNFILAKDLRKLIDEFQSPKRFMIGEVFGNHNDIKNFLGDRHDGLNLIFLFDMKRFSFNCNFFKGQILKYEKYYAYPNVPVFVYSNHDDRRSIGRVNGSVAKAKLLALFQIMARGVIVTYMGEEIGMIDTPISLKDAKDPVAQLYKLPPFIVDRLPLLINRDQCRTPMQWDTTANAGFSPTGIKTWLPVNKNYLGTNVQKALADSNSLIFTYKKLLDLRSKMNCIKHGSIEVIENRNIPSKILIFKRMLYDEEILVMINFENREFTFSNPLENSKVIFNTHPGTIELIGKIKIAPYQGLVLFHKEDKKTFY
jgi:alpha-glucosidase